MAANKVLISHQMFCSLLSLLWVCKPISAATFENVSLTLKWRSSMQDSRTVTVLSDDYLRTYVGDFGDVVVMNQLIPELRVMSVSNLSKVTALEFVKCGIKKIAAGAFQNLPMLTDLNLSDNLIEEIDNGVFSNLVITTLYLENNRISRIADQAFNNLKLKYLFLDYNKISEWKNEWFQGTPLEIISISNNLLQTLPRLAFEFLWHFASDPTLINLTLRGNRLTHIDPDAFKGIKSIINLDVQNNSLVHLEPGMFDTVEKIDQINLSHNRISEIYYEAFRNTKVSLMNVYDNLLTCVPVDFLSCTQIQILNIERNPISCSCVMEWTEWKNRHDLPKIDNWKDLKKGCKSEAATRRAAVSVFVFLFLSAMF